METFSSCRNHAVNSNFAGKIRYAHTKCRARPPDRMRAERARVEQQRRQRASQAGELPDTGYFAPADTRAPLYKPVTAKVSEDVSQRSKDRWESDFIWNTKWQDQLDYEKKAAVEKERQQREKKEAKSGFLSLSRVNELNSLDTELTAPLLQHPPERSKPPVPVIEMQPKQKGMYEPPASAAEAKRYRRSAGYIQRAASTYAEAPAPDDKQLAALAQEERRYEQIKLECNRWTTAAATICFAVVYNLYTRDTAASYLIGALGGIVYLRLLNRTVDSVGASSFGQAAGGTLGQPRLLIPVILVLLYNRYNLLYAESFDLHLELLPMLLGFFTYKLGVVAQGASDLVKELASNGEQPAFARDASVADAQSESGFALPNVDDKAMKQAFAERVLTR